MAWCGDGAPDVVVGEGAEGAGVARRGNGSARGPCIGWAWAKIFGLKLKSSWGRANRNEHQVSVDPARPAYDQA